MEGPWRRTLFEDPLTDAPRPGWTVPPDTVVVHPEGERAYFLDWKRGPAALARVGDQSWQAYRVDVEMLPASREEGFLGLNFHVSSDGRDACNIHFPCDGSGQPTALQTGCIWGESHSWKLYPESMGYAIFPAGRWIRLRVDVTETFANLYVNDASLPAVTMHDLPLPRGGIQFWSDHGSGWCRNLRVTDLSGVDLSPGMVNPWDAYRGLEVVRAWQVTRPRPLDFGRYVAPESLGGLEWVEAQTDARGVMNLTRLFPRDNVGRVVFARATVRAAEARKRTLRLTYTDGLTLWCNNVRVFDGPRRGWGDPDRERHLGGRLIPDEYAVELPLEAKENTLLARSEGREPFGWGFCMRLS